MRSLGAGLLSILFSISVLGAAAKTNNDTDDHLMYSSDENGGIESNDQPELTEKDLQTDENKKTDNPNIPEPINEKTAKKLREEEEKRQAQHHDHIEVVPYFKYEKAPVLKKRLKNGTKIYATKPSPQHYSGGFSVGPYSVSNLQGDTAGITFKNIYGKSTPLSVNLDFEYQFFKGAGKLGVAAGLGFFTASGQGRFKSNPALQADALFTLYAFPLNVSLLYHIQFWDSQPIVPFTGVGVDYFAMMETRSDKTNLADKIRFGGAAAWHWTAGAQFMLDGLDKEVIWQLDHEYGISHVYLTADARQVFGLSQIFDFSSMVYEGGFLFEF